MSQLFTHDPFQRGHRNWALRPTDQGFDDITKVQEILQSRRLRSVEIDLNLPEVARHGDISAEGEEIIVTDPHGNRYGFTPWGFRSLCKRIGAHTEFLKKLPASNVASDLKHLLRATSAYLTEEDGSIAGQWGKDQLVLTEKQGPGKPSLIRGVSSQRYGRVWDSEVADWVANLIRNFGFKVPESWDKERPRGLYVSDEDCFFFLGNQERSIEVTRPDGRTETLYRGMMAWNSEVGKRTVGFCTFLYQMICGNHIVWGADKVQTLQTRHVGNALDRAADDILPQIQAYMEADTKQETEVLFKAMHTLVSKDPVEILRKLKAFGFTKGVASDAMVLAATDPTNEGLDPKSYMAIVNGLTLKARDLPNADARNALETKAAQFLRTLSK